jgi:hypothetical protein
MRINRLNGFKSDLGRFSEGKKLFASFPETGGVQAQMDGVGVFRAGAKKLRNAREEGNRPICLV